MKIKKNLVSRSKYNIKCPYMMDAEYITFHNTYNDASAENEIKYMISNNNQVSYHFAVDDKEVIQGIPLNRNAWHCGDGQGNGNRKSIGIEVCYSKSGGERYRKAEQNAIKFIAQLLYERDWGVSRVKKHQDWSGKYCPHRVLDENRWGVVIKAIQSELDRLKGNPKPNISKPKPSKPSKPTTNKPNYNTKSVVTFLQSIGKPFGIDYRKQLASYYGIKNYTGKAVQNLQLLDLLQKDYKATGTIKSTPPKNAPKKPIKTSSKPATGVKTGAKVKIKSSAKHYSRTTTAIPTKYKNKTYTVQQVGKDDVLIKELYSWVKKDDLVGTSTSSSKPKPKTLKVGQTVTLSKSAKTFATGESILNSAKGKKYKIIQVKSDRVLLDKIMSWVKKSDVN